eukprot:1139835-Pelagomonas_calceolata.AAC.4
MHAPGVLRVDSHSCIAQHGLRARGSHHNLAASLQRVPAAPGVAQDICHTKGTNGTGCLLPCPTVVAKPEQVLSTNTVLHQGTCTSIHCARQTARSMHNQ